MKSPLFKRIKYVGIFLSLVCSLSAQINIKGTVLDNSSSPIKGAAVHLVKADKIEFTNDKGEFNITDNSRSTAVSENPFRLPAVFNGTAPFTMDAAYNVKGIRKAVTPHISADRGDFASENGLSSGIFITKTEYGGKTHYGKLALGEGSGNQRLLSGAHSEKSGRALQKSAASDVLVVAALGKNTHKMDVSDLGADVGSIKLGDNGKKTYRGFTQMTLKNEGADVYIVLPKTPHPAMPSIWRSTFWNDDPDLDMYMLERGYHLVYIPSTKGKLGNDAAMKLWTDFYEVAVKYYRFWPKLVISGWSRGGFHIFHFAAYNPEKVSVVAADATSCNVRAWPGLGKSLGGAYGMSKAEEEAWDQNPSDSAIVKPMAEAKIAVIYEVGKTDGAVKQQYCHDMAEDYKDRGGVYEVRIIEGRTSHTDHMLKPEEIEPFIKKWNPLPDQMLNPEEVEAFYTKNRPLPQ